MRLLVDGLIYQHQQRGGISAYFSAVLPRLCELDPAMEITLFYTGFLQQPLPSHDRIQIVKLPAVEKLFRPGRFFQRQGAAARLALARQRFQDRSNAIWHSTYFTSLEAWPGPEVVTVHDMIYERFPELFNRRFDQGFREQKSRAIRQASLIMCDSQATRDDLCQILNIDPQRCKIIPLACSEAFYSEPTLKNASLGSPYLLFVGRRYHYKNFTFLLEALSRWKALESVELVVAGTDPWSPEELRLINNLGLQERLRLELNPDDHQLRRLYNGAQALVFPSLYEGFGLPLLEAMNCGCPIVASRIPSTLEVAGDVPVYFDPYNPDGLLAALEQIFTEGRISQRIALGLERAQVYSWDLTAQKMLAVYRELA